MSLQGSDLKSLLCLKTGNRHVFFLSLPSAYFPPLWEAFCSAMNVATTLSWLSRLQAPNSRFLSLYRLYRTNRGSAGTALDILSHSSFGWQRVASTTDEIGYLTHEKLQVYDAAAITRQGLRVRPSASGSTRWLSCFIRQTGVPFPNALLIKEHKQVKEIILGFSEHLWGFGKKSHFILGWASSSGFLNGRRDWKQPRERERMLAPSVWPESGGGRRQVFLGAAAAVGCVLRQAPQRRLREAGARRHWLGSTGWDQPIQSTSEPRPIGPPELQNPTALFLSSAKKCVFSFPRQMFCFFFFLKLNFLG